MAHVSGVCEYCVMNILESNLRRGLYHPKYSELRLSASRGCPFCLVLYEDSNKAQQQAPSSNRKDAKYYWTIRPAGKIRESQAYITITFRLHLTDNVFDDLSSIVNLKERVFYLLPNEDLGNLPSSVELGLHTNCARSCRRVKTWMEACTKHHPKCNLRESGRDFIPTRLVDLGEPGAEWATKNIRIIHTQASGLRARYVTLSHCWGQKPFYCLKKEVLGDSLVLEVPLEQLDNKNFTDAASVARYLGVRYIWVDSLCIIQDDDEDWKTEAQLMHQVYRNSHCNIAAVHSSDKNGGLFRMRDESTTDRLVPVQYRPSDGTATKKPSFFGKGSWRILSRDLWQDGVLAHPLYTRAWVFQERLLSPRLLHFSRDQIFWDCATLSACETLPDGIPPVLEENQVATDRHWRERLQSSSLMINPLSGTANDSLHTFWSSAVRFYTGCDLTKRKDKLKALWGIAKLVRDASCEEYGAGLWEPGLSQQLSWRVLGWRKPTAYSADDPDPEFPSWSWASINGTIEIADRMKTHDYYQVTNHQGNSVSFQLISRVFAKHTDSGLSSWSDEIHSMTSRMEERQASIVSSIQNAKLDPESAMPPSQGVVSILSSQYQEVTANIESTKAKQFDAMPELRVNTLEIQGHISRGRLVKSNEEHNWHIDVHNSGETSARVRAFPDRPLEIDEIECLFVVLSAGREIDDDEEFFSEDDESEILNYTYFGTGIIIELDSEDRYRRTGAIEFEDINSEQWATFRHECCGNPYEKGEHSLECGIKFFLV